MQLLRWNHEESCPSNLEMGGWDAPVQNGLGSWTLLVRGETVMVLVPLNADVWEKIKTTCKHTTPLEPCLCLLVWMFSVRVRQWDWLNLVSGRDWLNLVSGTGNLRRNFGVEDPKRFSFSFLWSSFGYTQRGSQFVITLTSFWQIGQVLSKRIYPCWAMTTFEL